jgi:regulator of protease activity HflC (stomatin/prohibitin superfamily)
MEEENMAKSGLTEATSGQMQSAKAPNRVSSFVAFVIIAAGWLVAQQTRQWQWIVAAVIAAAYVLAALQIARQWEKVVVLRLGKFHRLAGPGMFWLIPIVDQAVTWIDHRVMVTPFKAERTLTKDTVPIDVDAVLFWVVWDAEKAALEVQSYREAISWAAQTALRDMLGATMLADILVGRQRLDEELQRIIDQRTTPWGITVQSVEIRDVIIPADLENAMSRQAQAERERQARLILGESEKQIAGSFLEAAQYYESSPVALHLRAMNMLFEGLKERGAMVIVPSSAVDTMNLGGLAGMVSLGQAGGNREPGMSPKEKAPVAAEADLQTR